MRRFTFSAFQHFRLSAFLAAAALSLLPQPATAQLTVDYGFTTNATLPDDGTSQYTTSHTLGGLASYSDVNVSLNLTTPDNNNPMWLGDLYSSLTVGLPSETPRVAVLLNRPGRDTSNPFGSSLSAFNVTLDDAAGSNVFGASGNGTYQSDGRSGVNPYGAPVNGGTRNATLTGLNGSAFTSNSFTLLMADTSAGGQAQLASWGMTLTGTAASSGTMSGDGGTFAISDGAGTTNTLGADVVTTQNGGGALLVTINGTTDFTGVISGSSGFTKSGTGTVTLSRANTYTGTTTINSGTLALGTSSTVTGGVIVSGPVGTGTLILAGGSTVRSDSNTARVINNNVSASGNITLGDAVNTGSLTISSLTTTPTTFALTADTTLTTLSNVNLSEAITGNFALTKSGSANLALGRANSYNGTVVNLGRLALNGSATLGLTTGSLTVNGGSVDMQGTNQTVGALLGSGGAVDNVGFPSGSITVGNGGASGSYSGIIANGAGGGTLSFTKTGNGTQTLAGTTANTYTGTTTVSQGELDLSKSNGVNAIGGNVLINGGTLKWLADNQIADSAMISMTSGALSLNGHSETVVDLTNTGGTFTTGAGTWTGTGSSMTWGGGTNTVNTGGTIFENHLTITAGTNEIQAGGLVQLSLTGLTMNGGTVTLDADPTTPGKLALMSNVMANDGTTSNILTSNATNAGVVDLTGGTRIFTIGTSNAATTLNVSASITSSGGNLVKAGPGSLVLTGNNTYTGTTTVNGGTLNAGATGALGATSSVTVNSGGTLLLSGSGNLNRVNNSAGISLGGGTLSRTGSASEGTGATIVNGSATGGSNSTGLGALTLTATSNLDFGSSGVGTLAFASFTPSGNTLNILNYLNTSANFATNTSGVDGTDDRLIFATDQSLNLGAFNFGGGFTAQEIALGSGYFEIIGVTAVPEPTTYAAGALAAAALLISQRRRIRRVRALAR